MIPEGFFDSATATVTASAPGRLDVIGGIADYSGSLVLEMPIAEATEVTAAKRSDGILRVFSENAVSINAPSLAEFTIADITPSTNDHPYANFRQAVPAGCDWSGYVIGCFLVLERERGIRFTGCDLYVRSDVPTAKGVSSSASLEVATMCAISSLFEVQLNGNDIPALCQKVENEVVGAPCGLMDQLTCYHGQDGELLPILCQPDAVGSGIKIPKGVCFAGIDSGVRHAVSGASYGDVRTSAFMGFSIIASQLGLEPGELQRARKTGDRSKLPFSGYLANVGRDQFDREFAEQLPEVIRGSEFLERWGVTIDPVTEVNPDSDYGVRAATLHPVYEHDRVSRFMELLGDLENTPDVSSRLNLKERLGDLMVQAHESYNACGLGNDVTDDIVRKVMTVGPAGGVYGAKITGGGSGGTVCVLADKPGGVSCVRSIAEEIRRESGTPPFLFLGSSDGARWKR